MISDACFIYSSWDGRYSDGWLPCPKSEISLTCPTPYGGEAMFGASIDLFLLLPRYTPPSFPLLCRVMIVSSIFGIVDPHFRPSVWFFASRAAVSLLEPERVGVRGGLTVYDYSCSTPYSSITVIRSGLWGSDIEYIRISFPGRLTAMTN